MTHWAKTSSIYIKEESNPYKMINYLTQQIHTNIWYIHGNEQRKKKNNQLETKSKLKPRKTQYIEKHTQILVTLVY